ncbi:hypothetical protein DSCA_08340 [Desulfosarcina alkanivorans]|uniref:Uncharacterized protein n=1 Tax=Desulfosarcina alkanivorans TaxID=571177 RepID=A0A5K7YKS9_9BACT|nr:hypothetical protein [Desulfosarcina alkanivorans]BBO66904.1 hypothetical protein DSCA_08340 [Desulfosarcina alkanivorans]
MVLKPQDVLVLAKLFVIGGDKWSYGRMATTLWMSPSEVHAGVKRLIKARLASDQQNRITPNVRNLESFLLHGLTYVFVPDLGEITRGMPTGYAGPVLSPFFQAGEDLPPVWPDPDGEVRGQSFSPLYKSVPKAAREDERLYELLSLIDAIRGGRAREWQMAYGEIKKRMGVEV